MRGAPIIDPKADDWMLEGYKAALDAGTLNVRDKAAVEIKPGDGIAGVAKVPIASVVMVSEMTGSYTLLAPLMLVSVVHLLLRLALMRSLRM